MQVELSIEELQWIRFITNNGTSVCYWWEQHMQWHDTVTALLPKLDAALKPYEEERKSIKDALRVKCGDCEVRKNITAYDTCDVYGCNDTCYKCDVYKEVFNA